jgi:hypothetical protein
MRALHGWEGGPLPHGHARHRRAGWVVAAVLAASASPLARAADDPFEAAQDGIDWLLPAVCRWMLPGTAQFRTCTDDPAGACFGCHVQAEAVYGLALSRTRCFTLPATACEEIGDETPLTFAARFVTQAQRKECILGPPAGWCGMYAEDPTTRDGRAPNLGSIGVFPDCGEQLPPPAVAAPATQSAHGGLGLAGYTRFVGPLHAGSLVALADWLVTAQEPTGELVSDHAEAPVDQGDTFTTAALLVTLRTATPHASPAQAATYADGVARAAVWLAAAPAATTQDEVLALLALLESGEAVTSPEVEARRADLLLGQLGDGGWAERPGLQSNAYATGQAAYALMTAGLPPAHPAVCAGIDWLVTHQEADGSWSIGQAGVSTDSTRNSAFTATTWPVLALGSLKRHGVEVTPPPDLASCAEEEAFEVVVRNTADNPCELYPRQDTFRLVASNDAGDDVSVDEATVTLHASGSATVTVRWRRAGPVTERVSTTTLRATSLGALAIGCPVNAEASFAVRVGTDTVPGPLGFGLRLSRPGDDVELRWTAAAGAVGSYEVVGLDCPSRDACPERPRRAVLDAATPRATTPPMQLGTTFPGAGRPGGPGLVFYKVRPTSPCRLLPGPTCNFDCAEADRCHRLCP